MTEIFGVYSVSLAKVYEAQLCIKLVLEERYAREAGGFLSDFMLCFVFLCILY